MDNAVLIIAGRPLDAFDLSLAGAVLLAVFIMLVSRVASQARLRAQLEATEKSAELETQIEMFARSQTEITGRLQTMTEIFGARQVEVTKALSDRLDSVSHRLGQAMLDTTRHTSEGLSKLNERLTVLDMARQSISDLSVEVTGLKSILSNKQARGAFGQARMENIVADGLPTSAYDFQTALSNGKRPDCVIRLPSTPEVLVVDAKFPLEAIGHWREAKNADERKQAAQRLKSDVQRHIDDISSKYFIPGETQDIALMFVPAESVYADLNEHFDEIMQRAFRARVILVSPSLLMMAIQVMQAIVRDARMREEARLIQTEVGHLLEDVRRLKERAGALEKHFGQAGEDMEKLQISADRIIKRGARIEAVELGDDAVVPLPTLPLRAAAE